MVVRTMFDGLEGGLYILLERIIVGDHQANDVNMLMFFGPHARRLWYNNPAPVVIIGGRAMDQL